MDQRFCYKQAVNFTYGLSDTMFFQFKTDKSFRARGFNCTVACEGFDFSALFARIPFTDNAIDEEDEDYDDDDLEEDYYDYESEEENQG